MRREPPAYATALKPGEAATRQALARLLIAKTNQVPHAFIDCDTAASLIASATGSWLKMIQNAGPVTYSLRPESKKRNVPTLMI